MLGGVIHTTKRKCAAIFLIKCYETHEKSMSMSMRMIVIFVTKLLHLFFIMHLGASKNQSKIYGQEKSLSAQLLKLMSVILYGYWIPSFVLIFIAAPHTLVANKAACPG